MNMNYLLGAILACTVGALASVNGVHAPVNVPVAGQAVLGVTVRHLPIAFTRPLTTAARVAAALGGAPVLTRYAVDQLTDGMVLDTSRARDQGWLPQRTLADYLGQVGRGGPKGPRSPRAYHRRCGRSFLGPRR